MTKCKTIECIYISDLEYMINSFIVGKDIINVSVISGVNKVYAFIIYRQ